MKPWPRAIILVDMNAFFASIEQQDKPELKGQPVAITNGEQGSCIITASYEARAYGIKTDMHLRAAKKLCPHLIRLPANPQRYAEVSGHIMEALSHITPDLEIFSVDEAFLDVTHCQRLYGDPIDIAKRAKQAVKQASGLSCSIGISGDKTTAKYAAKRFKPNGFCVIPPWEAKQRLHDVAVTELCGIAKGIGNFLAQYGVYTCGDMERLPMSILAQRFGNLGRRLWLMCQGADPEPVQTHINPPKSMGHGKVMPPGTREKHTVLLYLRYLIEKLAARLRRHQMQAQHFFIGVKSLQRAWYGNKTKLITATNDASTLYHVAKKIILSTWQGQGLIQIQVTALDPKPTQQQFDLLIEHDLHQDKVNDTLDDINRRYGAFIIKPASLLQHSKMTNVISPAWKPTGHRQTIDNYNKR